MPPKLPSTAWKPGQSGNPRGRPPKKRALTTLLEKGGNVKYAIEDEEIAAKKVFAAHVWEGLATGKIEFGNNEKIVLDGSQYIALAKLVLGQIDGPPKTEFDMTSEGKAIKASPTLDDMKGLLQLMGQREKDDAETS